jgi:hypothetical protein
MTRANLPGVTARTMEEKKAELWDGRPGLWPTILGELTAAATIPNASIAPTLVQRGRKCVCLSPCSPYASLRAPDRFTDAATRCLRLGCPPPNSRHGAKTPCASLWAQRPRPLPAVRAAVGFLLASLLVPSILGHAAWQLCRRLSRRHRARGAVVVTPHPPHGRHHQSVVISSHRRGSTVPSTGSVAGRTDRLLVLRADQVLPHRNYFWPAAHSGRDQTSGSGADVSYRTSHEGYAVT